MSPNLIKNGEAAASPYPPRDSSMFPARAVQMDGPRFVCPRYAVRNYRKCVYLFAWVCYNDATDSREGINMNALEFIVVKC